MKVIREYYENNCKVTVYELNLEPMCELGTHISGSDGVLCKYCGTSALEKPLKIIDEKELKDNLEVPHEKLHTITLDDFM